MNLDLSILRQNHIVVTTYDVVKSEFGAFKPAAKDESKQSKLKSKSKGSDSDSDDSLPIRKKTMSRTPKVKDATMKMKWWRVVLG